MFFLRLEIIDRLTGLLAYAFATASEPNSRDNQSLLLQCELLDFLGASFVSRAVLRALTVCICLEK